MGPGLEEIIASIGTVGEISMWTISIIGDRIITTLNVLNVIITVWSHQKMSLLLRDAY